LRVDEHPALLSRVPVFRDGCDSQMM
jgi:hypothetical protein